MVVDYIELTCVETDTSAIKKKIHTIIHQIKIYEDIGKNKLLNVLQCVIDAHILIYFPLLFCNFINYLWFYNFLFIKQVLVTTVLVKH